MMATPKLCKTPSDHKQMNIEQNSSEIFVLIFTDIFTNFLPYVIDSQPIQTFQE